MLALIRNADESVLRWIGSHLRAAWLDPLMVLYTELGNGGLLFIAAAVLLLLFRKTRRAGAAAGLGLGLGALMTNLLIKPMAARPRPWVTMADWQPLLMSSDPHSFPSGHTTAAFAFAAAICVLLPVRWAKAAALLAAALMGFSRLYVGVHFPTDVLAGALVGTVCGIFGGWLIKKLTARIGRRKAAK